MDDPPFDRPSVDRLLTTTRAVRKRLDVSRPVPREVVLECLDLALQAPTGGNIQRWRWLVIDDPDLRAGLAELYQRAAGPYFEWQRKTIAESGRQGMGGILASAEYLAEHLAEVPVHVIPCALDRPPPAEPVGTPAAWYGSIFPAVWSFQLALRSRGLGSSLTTLHLEYEAEAAELLGIPPTVTQLALLPVAYTRGTDFKAGDRRPAAEVTYGNRWKSPI